MKTSPTARRSSPRRAEEIFVGIGAGTGVFRVTGTASVGHRGALNWTVVVKVLTLKKLDFQSTSAEPSAWDYWKREWHVYRSAWLPRLDGPLVAPRCFGSGSVCSESGGELAWIAMEDLASSQHGPWPISRFRLVAHHVGASNGRYLDAADQPADPWIARNWLRGWSELAAPFITQLAAAGAHPVAGRIFTADFIDDLSLTWEQREELHSALAALPQTFCHNDTFARNLFLRGDKQPHSVAIDWAFCGLAPIGQDLSALVGASQIFMEVPRPLWDDLEQTCLAGYLDGLNRSVGTTDSRAGRGRLCRVERAAVGAGLDPTPSRDLDVSGTPGASRPLVRLLL